MKEHGNKPDQPMYIYLNSCPISKQTINQFILTDYNNVSSIVSITDHILNAVLCNSERIDYNNNWNVLSYLEAIHIKNKSPVINKGLKASKELTVFK